MTPLAVLVPVLAAATATSPASSPPQRLVYDAVATRGQRAPQRLSGNSVDPSTSRRAGRFAVTCRTVAVLPGDRRERCTGKATISAMKLQFAGPSLASQDRHRWSLRGNASGTVTVYDLSD